MADHRPAAKSPDAPLSPFGEPPWEAVRAAAPRVDPPVRPPALPTFDDQLWPINVALAVLGSFVAGMVVAWSSFETPVWWRSGWTHLTSLAISLIVLMWLASRIDNRRGRRRMQMAALGSTLAHLLTLLVLYNNQTFAGDRRAARTIIDARQMTVSLILHDNDDRRLESAAPELESPLAVAVPPPPQQPQLDEELTLPADLASPRPRRTASSGAEVATSPLPEPAQPEPARPEQPMPEAAPAAKRAAPPTEVAETAAAKAADAGQPTLLSGQAPDAAPSAVESRPRDQAPPRRGEGPSLLSRNPIDAKTPALSPAALPQLGEGQSVAAALEPGGRDASRQSISKRATSVVVRPEKSALADTAGSAALAREQQTTRLARTDAATDGPTLAGAAPARARRRDVESPTLPFGSADAPPAEAGRPIAAGESDGSLAALRATSGAALARRAPEAPTGTDQNLAVQLAPEARALAGPQVGSVNLPGRSPRGGLASAGPEATAPRGGANRRPRALGTAQPDAETVMADASSVAALGPRRGGESRGPAGPITRDLARSPAVAALGHAAASIGPGGGAPGAAVSVGTPGATGGAGVSRFRTDAVGLAQPALGAPRAAVARSLGSGRLSGAAADVAGAELPSPAGSGSSGGGTETATAGLGREGSGSAVLGRRAPGLPGSRSSRELNGLGVGAGGLSEQPGGPPAIAVRRRDAAGDGPGALVGNLSRAGRGSSSSRSGGRSAAATSPTDLIASAPGSGNREPGSGETSDGNSRGASGDGGAGGPADASALAALGRGGNSPGVLRATGGGDSGEGLAGAVVGVGHGRGAGGSGAGGGDSGTGLGAGGAGGNGDAPQLRTAAIGGPRRRSGIPGPVAGTSAESLAQSTGAEDGNGPFVGSGGDRGSSVRTLAGPAGTSPRMSGTGAGAAHGAGVTNGEGDGSSAGSVVGAGIGSGPGGGAVGPGRAEVAGQNEGPRTAVGLGRMGRGSRGALAAATPAETVELSAGPELASTGQGKGGSPTGSDGAGSAAGGSLAERGGSSRAAGNTGPSLGSASGVGGETGGAIVDPQVMAAGFGNGARPVDRSGGPENAARGVANLAGRIGKSIRAGQPVGAVDAAAEPIDGGGAGIAAAGASGEAVAGPGANALAVGERAAAGQRTSGGLQVLVATASGPGGLGAEFTTNIGVASRRAQRDAEVASIGEGRFQNRRTGGPLAVDGHARDAARAYRPRAPLGGRGEPGGAAGARSAGRDRAVELGLDFLARNQSPDGNWSLRFGRGRAGYEAERASLQSDTAATGLALLAFLGAGYDHFEDAYQQQVLAGLDWLVKHQKPDGDLYLPSDDKSSQAVWLYSHAIAAIALCEAFGMTGDETLREPAQKSLDFIIRAQDPKQGGWRYGPAKDSDTSVTGWQLMALKSGELAGLRVPRETYQNVARWLDAAQKENGALYVYHPFAKERRETGEWAGHGRNPSPTMTAVGLLCRLYLGWNRDDARMKQGAEYLRSNLPTISQPEKRDTYYWYYATQVMFHMRGQHWQQWNDKLHPLLIERQVRGGPMAGSWEPRGPMPDRFGEQCGRLYVTTMNLLSLEVDYRHLPLYDQTAQ